MAVVVFSSPDLVSEICKHIAHPIDCSRLRQVNTMFRDSLTPVVKTARSRAWIPQIGTEVTFFDGDRIEIAGETGDNHRIVRLLQDGNVKAYTVLHKALDLKVSFEDDVELAVQMKRLLQGVILHAQSLCTCDSEILYQPQRYIDKLIGECNIGLLSKDEALQLIANKIRRATRSPCESRLHGISLFEVLISHKYPNKTIKEMLQGKYSFEFNWISIDKSLHQPWAKFIVSPVIK